jgi:hypothetical protein
MLRKLSILVASSTLSLVTITAIAQPAPPMREPLTREVASTRAATMFARLDVNSDGQLTQADREARTEARGEARFERIDTNGDDAISRTEFDAHRDQMQGRRQAGSGEGRRDHAMARGEGRRGPMQGRMMGGRRDLVRTADADSNGAITQAEFTSAMLTRFDTADADKDGAVSREERRAARQPAQGAS